MRQLATLEQELVKEQKLAIDEQETDKEPPVKRTPLFYM